MDSSDRELYQMEIDMLKMQIEEQKIRQQTMNKLNQVLSQKLVSFSSITADMNRLEETNQLLIQNMNNAEQRHSAEIRYYDSEILKLKDELSQKFNEIERVRLEADKKILKLQDRNSFLQGIIQKKCMRVTQLQTKMHETQIQSYQQSAKQSQLSYMPTITSNQLAISTIRNSHAAHSNIENNMHLSNIALSNSVKTHHKNSSRASNTSKRSQKKDSQIDLMSMNKEEMKIMMKSLVKSKKQLENGSNELSMLSQISTITANNPKKNKTIIS